MVAYVMLHHVKILVQEYEKSYQRPFLENLHNTVDFLKMYSIL